MSTPKIYIIGAGVSGLTCAIELERAGYSPTIIESTDRVGGRLKTDIVDGIPLDRGFQVLLTEYPAARRYLDAGALDLKKFRPGAVIIKDGKQKRFGDFIRDRSFFPATLVSPHGSLKDKFNTYLLTKRLKSKRITDLFDHSPGSTMKYLRSKGFSEQMINEFFVPFYGGIFLEKELTTPASMFAFTLKMLSIGHAAIPALGIEEVARQLKSKLNNTEFIFETPVSHVRTGEVILENEEVFKTDAVIWTCPPKDLEPELKWRSCSTHYFYTDKSILNDNIIALLPDAASVNSIHYVTDLMGRNTDKHVLSATVVGQSDALLDDVISDLRTHCKIDTLDHISTSRIEHALPHLTMAVYAPQQDVTRMMPGVYRAGDVMANASLNAAMESGRVAAKTLVGDLQR